MKLLQPGILEKKDDKTAVCKFYLAVYRFHARVQTLTCTTYDKYLRENIMAVLTSKSGIGAVAKFVIESLWDDEQAELTDGTDRFCPYPNDFNLEKLTNEVPGPMKTFLDTINSKSRTETGEKKKKLGKIAVTHPLMQFCKNKIHLSPLLLAVGLFIHKVSRSQFLVDVLHSVGFSVLYSEVCKFEECAALSIVKFDDFLSDSEFESENRF